MTTQRTIETYLMDMDGVLVHQERLIPGADQFISRLQDTGHRFLVLTNNSIYTPRDLAARLALTGLQVPEQAIWTSALATARFLPSRIVDSIADLVDDVPDQGRSSQNGLV
jgi:NagD protein